jgi:hypothetical protein
LKGRNIRNLKAAEMEFMRHTPRYTVSNHRGNEDILEEIKAGSV